MKIGVINFEPARLTQARESLGLTKAALATLLQVSPATITNWEKSSQLPTEEKLNRLAELLNFDTSWFLNPSVEMDDRTPYFYRSLSVATKTSRNVAKIKLNWLSEIVDILDKKLDWPETNLPSISEEQFLQIDDSEIEEISLECRKRWGLGTGPIENLTQSLEGAGIFIAKASVGTVKMDGVSKWTNKSNRPFMLIANDKSNATRNRFDIAHELGHLVLHRNLSNENFKKYFKEIERQANYFAGCFLLPSESFAYEINWPNLDSLLVLKKRWKTSVSAMVMRSYQLNLIDDNQKMRLYKSSSARGWSRGEPYDNEIGIEEPRLLQRAIHLIVEHKIYSKKEILHEIGLPNNIVEELCSLTPGYFDIKINNNVVNIKDFKSKKDRI